MSEAPADGARRGIFLMIPRPSFIRSRKTKIEPVNGYSSSYDRGDEPGGSRDDGEQEHDGDQNPRRAQPASLVFLRLRTVKVVRTWDRNILTG
jgi:hypothetical protein